MDQSKVTGDYERKNNPDQEELHDKPNISHAKRLE